MSAVRCFITNHSSLVVQYLLKPSGVCVLSDIVQAVIINLSLPCHLDSIYSGPYIEENRYIRKMSSSGYAGKTKLFVVLSSFQMRLLSDK